MKLRQFLQERFAEHQVKRWLAEVHDGQQWVSARKMIGLNSGDDSVLIDRGHGRTLREIDQLATKFGVFDHTLGEDRER